MYSGKYLHFANAEMADLQAVINTTKIESFLKLLADGQVARSQSSMSSLKHRLAVYR